MAAKLALVIARLIVNLAGFYAAKRYITSTKGSVQ